MIFSFAACTLALLLFLKSRKIWHLTFWYAVAVAIGLAVPFGGLLSWAVMVIAPYKEDYKPKPNSFDKAFENDEDE